MKKIDTRKNFVWFRQSAFGFVGILWSVFKRTPKVFRILIPTPAIPVEQIVAASYPGCSIASCTEINALANQINAFLTGEDIRFPLDIIRLDLCSSFQHRVLHAEHAIPRGRVSSYGLIAKHLNKPKAARAVGTALATNPFPIIIPCHRAVRSNGHLGGFQGGLAMKRALLEMEAVEFRDKMHVIKDNFFYLSEHTDCID